jgi:alpha-L-arabinofuranosidase
MTRKTNLWLVCLALQLVVGAATRSVSAAARGPAVLDIDVNKPGPTIPPTFYGLMTEEINHSYDGGLFAELIQNRTFQDPKNRRVHTPEEWPIHWWLLQDDGGKASMHTDRSDPVNAALPVSLRLDLADGRAGVANDGYWGIPIRPDTAYTASFYAKGAGGFSGPVTAAIVTDDGNVTVAKGDSDPITNTWQKYTVTLKTSHDAPTTAKAHFALFATGTSGSVSFSLVSLFPPTYMDTPGGLRPDLMKLMADMHPAFIRLPGGNYVEGDTFPTRFDWKKMIGPADQRPGHMGCWSYRSSDGFGLPQYLLWCKQLNAEPVLAVFAGFTLNHDHFNAGEKLQPYVDEALEEIEYVSGPADSTWGKRRAEDGLPEPLPLHYVEIGNEDFFDRSGSYDGRFTQFFDAIKNKYPQLKIIATTPVHSRTPDLVDDHYYRSARQMASDWRHYDRGTEAQNRRYPRTGPQIFVGEWATQEGQPTPDLNAALADAAWTMGMERDADLIPIQCYAPLLVNVNPEDRAKGYPKGWQWPTNLIGYDALTSFGSPSYYALALFGQNKGDTVLPVTMSVPPTIAAVEPNPRGMIGVGTWHTEAEYKEIVVTSPDGKTPLLTANLANDTHDWRFTGPKFNFADQAMKPSAADSTCWATTGDQSWTDYTLRLKARKLSGAEGFLILYHAIDGENFNWLNIGGWNNTKTQFEATHDNDRAPFGPSSNFKVETNRWYDIRLEVTGHRARCFIDDKQIIDATEQPQTVTPPLFASASYANDSHTVIVKVVNMAQEPIETTLNLRGATQINPQATAIVMGGQPRDVNTIDQPTKVAPKEEPLTNAGESFTRTFPPHSLTVLRVGATAAQ